jgi:hypothetical protein
MIYMRSVPYQIVKEKQAKHRVEAGSNTSNMALRVVGGNEKRTQCLGV